MLTWYELTRQEDKLILFLKMGFGGQRTEFGGRGWSLLTDEEPHPLAPAKQQVSKAGAAHFRPLWGGAFQDLPFQRAPYRSSSSQLPS